MTYDGQFLIVSCGSTIQDRPGEQLVRTITRETQMLHGVAAMMRRSLVPALLVAIPITLATATNASAAPSERSSCAAQYAIAFRPPGHGGPVGGEKVSQAARFLHGDASRRPSRPHNRLL